MHPDLLMEIKRQHAAELRREAGPSQLLRLARLLRRDSSSLASAWWRLRAERGLSPVALGTMASRHAKDVRGRVA
jgi:hypothetical protein